MKGKYANLLHLLSQDVIIANTGEITELIDAFENVWLCLENPDSIGSSKASSDNYHILILFSCIM